jgi:transcriptional regulator with XRE-family HTH domain
MQNVITSEALGRKIEEARVKARLNRTQLASAIEVDPSAVKRWEAGDHYPSVYSFCAICHELGLSADELLEVGDRHER